MTPEQEMLRYLYQHIPMAKAMKVEVLELNPQRVALGAELAANSNHKGTAFGGSLGSLMTLSCWCWLWAELKRHQVQSHVVVRSSSTEFFHPVTTNFVAGCEAPDQGDLERFWKILRAKGKAQILMHSEVGDSNKVLASLSARFVATLVR